MYLRKSMIGCVALVIVSPGSYAVGPGAADMGTARSPAAGNECLEAHLQCLRSVRGTPSEHRRTGANGACDTEYSNCKYRAAGGLPPPSKSPLTNPSAGRQVVVP